MRPELPLHSAETKKTNSPKVKLDRIALDQITAILTEIFQDELCAIYLFGSRITGTATAASDFDLGVLSSRDLSYKLSLAREKLEQSNIPYKVDLVDLRKTSVDFRHQVQAKGVLLWQN
jgi:hypothetical protein